jgi:hypothetical protein
VGLADTTSIDIVMQPRPGHPEDGKLVLIAFDGELRDEAARFNLLINKLRVYVEYICGRQCRRDHGVDWRDVRIYVVCAPHNPPTPAMCEILKVQPHGRPDQAIPVSFKVHGQGFP